MTKMNIQKTVLFICFIYFVVSQGQAGGQQSVNTRYINLGGLGNLGNSNNIGPNYGYPIINPKPTQQCCGFTTIKVRGEGSVSTQPDVASISVGAQQIAKDTQTATQNVNKKIAQALAVIKLYAVDTDIETQSLYTYPRTKYENGVSTVTGQVASQNIIVKLRKIGKGQKVAQFIDRISLINGIIVNYINFEIGNKDPFVTTARANAFQDAKQKAKDYAEFAGVRLTTVTTVQDNSYSAPSPIPYATAALKVGSFDAASTTTVDPSELTISADLTVTFEYI